jgi:hypothetical protein
MRDVQIEAWAVRKVAAIQAGGRPEDALVECKALWLDPGKAARQLGGHANAARGEPILWLIGVDEKRGPVPIENESAGENWWPQVVKSFEGVPPELGRDLLVFAGEQPFHALLIETNRAPYVLRRPGDCDVPWRDGTHTRSARREELLRMLDDRDNNIPLRIRSGTLSLQAGDVWQWEFQVALYAGAPFGSTIAIPDDDVSAVLTDGVDGPRLAFESAVLRPPTYFSSIGLGSGTSASAASQRHDTVHLGTDQVILTGPGPVVATGHTRTSPDDPDFVNSEALILTLEITPAFTSTSLVVSVTFVRSETDGHSRVKWTADTQAPDSPD